MGACCLPAWGPQASWPVPLISSLRMTLPCIRFLPMLRELVRNVLRSMWRPQRGREALGRGSIISCYPLEASQSLRILSTL